MIPTLQKISYFTEEFETLFKSNLETVTRAGPLSEKYNSS